MAYKSLKILCYADDTSVVVEKGEDSQRILLSFKETAERLNMIIFTEKKYNP